MVVARFNITYKRVTRPIISQTLAGAMKAYASLYTKPGELLEAWGKQKVSVQIKQIKVGI